VIRDFDSQFAVGGALVFGDDIGEDAKQASRTSSQTLAHCSVRMLFTAGVCPTGRKRKSVCDWLENHLQIHRFQPLPIDDGYHTFCCMTLIRLLANLGYGSRREVEKLIRSGVVTDSDGKMLNEKSRNDWHNVRVRGEPLDPPFPLVILMHKPAGVTCSRDAPGDLVFDLLPERFMKRNPSVSSVGRLDKDTTGLLLLTDDGQLLHRLISPKSKCPKTYIATLDRPLRGDEAAVFASGELMLNGESKPLLPAEMAALDERTARLVIHEGRYHQVRRMFAACGNHVTALHRIRVGSFELPEDLAPGEWRVVSAGVLPLIPAD